MNSTSTGSINSSSSTTKNPNILLITTMTQFNTILHYADHKVVVVCTIPLINNNNNNTMKFDNPSYLLFTTLASSEEYSELIFVEYYSNSNSSNYCSSVLKTNQTPKISLKLSFYLYEELLYEIQNPSFSDLQSMIYKCQQLMRQDQEHEQEHEHENTNVNDNENIQ